MEYLIFACVWIFGIGGALLGIMKICEVIASRYFGKDI